MLTFRKINWVFLFLLLLLVVLDFFYAVPWWGYLLLAGLYALILFYGCAFIQSNFFMRVICKANTSQKTIAITFDDGPAENFTPAILDILRRHQVKAAFFCIGKKIATNTALLKKTISEGHLIGNHSYSHTPFFDLLSVDKMIADLTKADDECAQRIGVTPRLFRPPYGIINPNLRKAILSRGYDTVGWSVRSFDTVSRDQKKLLNKLKGSLKPGAVFLFHDTMEITKKILPEFIEYVKEKGYSIERLDKLLFLQAYA